MRLCLYLLAAVLGLAMAPRAHADIDVRVGAGAGCQYATIQAAITAANNANGITNIKIARNTTYTAQQINITSKNVRLIGGFADCNQANPDSTKTVISGAGGSADTVISVLGTTSVVAFYHLDITGGDEVTSSNGLGGGVTVAGGPHALVFFDDDYIHGNQAGYGGGVFIRNEHSTLASDVHVYFGDNTRIDNNYGAYGGGGMYCSNAQVLFVGSNSHINNNSTAGTVNTVVINGSGGGIRAVNCQLWIGATSNLGTLTQNSAGGNGGGLSITGERAIARLYTRTANRAPTILLNTAEGVGGGIEVGSSAKLYGYDLVVAVNTARAGGAGISLFDNDDPPGTDVVLKGSLSGAPSDPNDPAGAAVNCDPSLHCNRISDNIAQTAAGGNQPGAAARVYTDGSSVQGGSIGSATLNLVGTEINHNTGESLLRVFSAGNGNSDMYVDGAAMVDNVVSGVLLHNPDEGGSFGNPGRLYVNNSTIAGNAIGGSEVFRTVHLFQLNRSIVWQPNKRVLHDLTDTPNATVVDYLLGSDLVGIPASTHNMVADPQFVDAAGSDYHLRLTSPAIDYVPAGGNSADHLPRTVDLAPVSNDFGPQDLGAYERQFACAVDTVFCSGFEQ